MTGENMDVHLKALKEFYAYTYKNDKTLIEIVLRYIQLYPGGTTLTIGRHMRENSDCNEADVVDAISWLESNKYIKYSSKTGYIVLSK